MFQNKFEILSLNGEKLITGSIRKENDEWKSIIKFVTVNIEFSNNRIIGRNDLIFTLADANVITENFELDKERLLKYIQKFNQLK